VARWRRRLQHLGHRHHVDRLTRALTRALAAKKLLVLVSSVTIDSISAAASSKSNTARFSSIRPFPNGLRDHDDPALNQPPQDDLRDALAVLRADGTEHLVLEDVCSARQEARTSP